MSQAYPKKPEVLCIECMCWTPIEIVGVPGNLCSKTKECRCCGAELSQNLLKGILVSCQRTHSQNAPKITES